MFRFSPFEQLHAFFDVQFIDFSQLTANVFARQFCPFWSIKTGRIDEIEFKVSIFHEVINQNRLHANTTENAKNILMPAGIEFFNCYKRKRFDMSKHDSPKSCGWLKIGWPRKYSPSKMNSSGKIICEISSNNPIL